jgi:hypothetical protein
VFVIEYRLSSLFINNAQCTIPLSNLGDIYVKWLSQQIAIDLCRYNESAPQYHQLRIPSYHHNIIPSTRIPSYHQLAYQEVVGAVELTGGDGSIEYSLNNSPAIIISPLLTPHHNALPRQHQVPGEFRTMSGKFSHLWPSRFKCKKQSVPCPSKDLMSKSPPK